MLTRMDKFLGFIRKPTKLQLLAERIENNKKVKEADRDSARIKEWLIVIFEQANKPGVTVEYLKPLMSCAIRGMTVAEVINFNKSAIPHEVQK